MFERWYLGFHIVDPQSEAIISDIWHLIKQERLEKFVPCLCHEQFYKSGQSEFYLFLAIVSKNKGDVPPPVQRLIEQLTKRIGPPLNKSLNTPLRRDRSLVWWPVAIPPDEPPHQVAAMPSSNIVSPPVAIPPDKPPHQVDKKRLTVDTASLEARQMDNPFDLSTQEHISGDSENYDRLLYWLSSVGSGTWQAFKKTCELLGLVSDSAEARHVFQRLRLLGHVEYLENGSKWAICPPCLVQQDANEEAHFLAGQRTLSMLEALKKNSFWENDAQYGAPTIIRLRNVADVRAALEGTNIRAASKVGRCLAEILPDLKGWQASLREFPIPHLGYEIHRWDGNDFTMWAEQPTEVGMYRYRNSKDDIQYFTFYDPERGNLRGDWYGLRYLANRYLGRKVEVWLNRDGRVAVPRQDRLPEIYERALVLASGHLPEVNDDWAIYSGISVKLLGLLSTKLGFEIKDSQK